MKQLLLCAGLLIALTACYKDKGNYDYTPVKDPVISNFDSTYIAYVGDSLIISPVVKLSNGSTDITGHWSILRPEDATSSEYDGLSLRIVYGLGASRHSATFTVVDNSNGMKYFYSFSIEGRTAFTTGTVVLSEQDGVGKLSFIKTDGTLQANIYEGINHEELGTGALQVVPVKNMYYLNVLTAYWIVCEGGTHPAVQINSDNMQRTKYINENFYEAPAVIKPDYFQDIVNGTTTAVINNQLYIGTTETAPFATYYGFYGVPVAGNYQLHKNFVFTIGSSTNYYMGFDLVKKNFIRFAGGSYYGTDYTQVDSFFNPKDLKMDLIQMAKFGDDNVYAFCDSVGKVFELKFALDFLDGNSNFKTIYKKPFPGAAYVKPDTRWASSPIGIFFFTSGDKIYRYNPLNGDVKVLISDFKGKDVTMIKVIEDGNRLIAGTDGSVYTLDVSTGKFGDILQTTDGLPGKVIDITIR
jgi:hypothetical protein